MITRNGIAVSPGVAVGDALVMGSEDFRIPQRFIPRRIVDQELERLRQALDGVSTEILENERLANEALGQQYGAIFGAHLQMAQDPKLISEVELLIKDRCYSPEFAASRTLRKYARQFQALGNAYFAERAADIYDLEKRILRHLLGEQRESLAELTQPVIVLAHNLTPSETAGLKKDVVLGFATEVGGRTSHTAILAAALEIPAIVGLGPFLADVSGGDTVVVDGTSGEFIIEPDDDTLWRINEVRQKYKSVAARRRQMRDLVSETKDGARISLMGNIEFPQEAEQCEQKGADGIGLYRTEFLYLGRDSIPTEEDHYNAYTEVISAFKDQPITIRTLDLGADKIPGWIRRSYGDDSNPALGLRSIRMSLHDMDMFKTQIRAVLRASVGAKVGIMFPLVSSLLEFRQARLIVREVMEDLEEQKIPFNSEVSLGIMVEVPATVLMAEEFAREVDFFSIGTNDLIQYTLAADRSDPQVAKWHNPADPAIIRMIDMVVKAAKNHDIPVSVCGQMSSDPRCVPLLIGMGIRQISVSPHAIPEIKEVIRNLTIKKAESIAAYAKQQELARDVESFLNRELRKLVPENVK
ncbi:phosphoenolpyruvate--protein phosphotransferase [Rubinisphaera margarita]|uniref:phosphoenolpyruvate--protein phosphotransferase n=1 Tax=Rubinisphaera margarita TaxID=2909586 RepID=UPI001EE8555B|nr:phosphoenolpyruvate--protein phosphotransferase [Rubinisphaera margarita]MCG6158428.1 phosphoenolpyruvate--protein phosphotransferase [Rubinisphaera margarita]